MNKTYERPHWCHCRLQLEIGIVGNWCIKHFGMEWAVISINQSAAVRTAGETRPLSETRGMEELKRIFLAYIFL